MRSLIAVLSLAGAGLYTAGLLFSLSPAERSPASSSIPSANVTVRAKQPRQAVPDPAPSDMSQPNAESTSTQSESAPPAMRVKRRSEWVQVAGYTAVVRSEPDASAPVLAAYPVGRPFRVIEREGSFAHVQDLGSGQLGWVKEASLAPFIGGYRLRETPAPARADEITVAAAEEPKAETAKAETAKAETPTPRRSETTTQKRRVEPYALAPRDAEVADEDSEGSVPETRRERRLHVAAARHEGDGFPAIMNRALSGY